MIWPCRESFLSCLLVLLLVGCGNTPPPKSGPTAVPAPQPEKQESVAFGETFDLGVIYQRESARRNGWVKNRTGKPIQIVRIEASCECLDVQLSKFEIAPGDRALAQLHYDGMKEPDFVGSLQIEVNLIGDNDQKVGTIQVPIEVIRADAESK